MYTYRPNIPGVKAELNSPVPIPEKKKQEFYHATLEAKKRGLAGRGGFAVEQRRKRQAEKQDQQNNAAAGAMQSQDQARQVAYYQQFISEQQEQTDIARRKELDKLRREGQEYRKQLQGLA